MLNLLEQLNESYRQLIHNFDSNKPDSNQSIDIMDHHLSLIQSDLTQLIIRIDQLNNQIISRQLILNDGDMIKLQQINHVNKLVQILSPQILALQMIGLESDSESHIDNHAIDYIS